MQTDSSAVHCRSVSNETKKNNIKTLVLTLAFLMKCGKNVQHSGGIQKLEIAKEKF
jgi:hypothetical protein